MTAMRDALVASGLLTPNGKLTSAGNERVEEIKDQLLVQPAPTNPTRPRVRWNCTKGRIREKAV